MGMNIRGKLQLNLDLKNIQNTVKKEEATATKGNTSIEQINVKPLIDEAVNKADKSDAIAPPEQKDINDTNGSDKSNAKKHFGSREDALRALDNGELSTDDYGNITNEENVMYFVVRDNYGKVKVVFVELKE